MCRHAAYIDTRESTKERYIFRSQTINAPIDIALRSEQKQRRKSNNATVFSMLTL